MRFASQRIGRVRAERARAGRAVVPEQNFQYREGLNITGEGPFPSISPGMPDMGIPDPMSGIYTEAPTEMKKVSVPTRLGYLG